MCPPQYYQIMRLCKDKKQYRYQMCQYALEHGNKPAARAFKTCPQVIRKWLRRFKLKNYSGLEDCSRRPHNSPQETPQNVKEQVIALKKKYKRLGAEQIKILENVNLSPKTMRKIWKTAGVSSRRRRKKYITKNNLRAVKKQFQLFEFSCEDTKDLCDIPEYWQQMKSLNLPSVQYTFREVSCGIQFLGFANERSLTHSTLFAEYINYCLKKFDALPSKSVRQTDNGSEYCGSWNAKEPSAYTKTIESLPGQIHQTIFPGAHRMQADVETVHNLSEMEFYELEKFTDRQDFFNIRNDVKVFSYQLFFNIERPNTQRHS